MVRALDREGEERDLDLRSTGNTVQMDAGIRRQGFQQIVGDGPFALRDLGILLELPGEPERLLEGGDRIEILGARLELAGDRRIGGSGEPDRLDHLSPAHIRRHRLEPLLLSIQHAGAGRAVHLVPGERVEVAVQLLDVDFRVDTPLRAVHEHRNAVMMRDPDDFLHRVNKA